MRKLRYVLALLLLMALAPLGSSGTAGAAGGSEGRIEARESEPPDTLGPLLTDTAAPAAKGTLSVQPFWSLGSVTGAFNTHGKRVSAGGNFRSFEYDLQITYGAWDNFEVFTFIPVKVNWANSLEEPGSSGERSAWHAGLGDLNLTLKYRLVKEGPVVPTITAVCATNFPTGRYKNVNPILQGTEALGSGSYVPTTGVNLSKWVKPFIFYANLYYSMPTSFTNNEGKQHPRRFCHCEPGGGIPRYREMDRPPGVHQLLGWRTVVRPQFQRGPGSPAFRPAGNRIHGYGKVGLFSWGEPRPLGQKHHCPSDADLISRCGKSINSQAGFRVHSSNSGVNQERHLRERRGQNRARGSR